MEIKTTKIKENIFGANLKNSSIAKCPWHKEITASLIADHSKGIFCCLSCGVKGLIVEGTDKHHLVLQREYS